MQSSTSRSLRPKKAAEFLGISMATLWRWVRERPDFPRTRKIGDRTTVFVEDELAEFRERQTQGAQT